MVADLCRVVFTTNFDTVVEKAVAEVGGQSLSGYHLEGARAANAALNNEEYPLYCKLHGDFRYDSLKNLSQDLEEQNSELSTCLVNAGNRFGFVVSGYSGRDESILRLFHRVLETQNPFPHGLYWTKMKGSTVPRSVSVLLDRASAQGVKAKIVETQTFDVFMLHLWRNIDGKPPSLDDKVRKSRLSTVDIRLPLPGKQGPLLRLTGLPILSVPERCHSLSFRTPKDWHDFRQAMANSQGRLILTKADAVWGWGSKEQLRKIFDGDLTSIGVKDFPKDIRVAENYHVKGFLERALSLSLTRERPLLARSRGFSAYLIVNSHASSPSDLAPLSDIVNDTSGVVPRIFTTPTPQYPRAEPVRWAEALRISVNEKKRSTLVAHSSGYLDLAAPFPQRLQGFHGCPPSRPAKPEIQRIAQCMAFIGTRATSTRLGNTGVTIRYRRRRRESSISTWQSHGICPKVIGMANSASELPGYTALTEPDLLFDNGRTGKHPLTGLIDYGPYGQRFGAPATVRLALLAPSSDIPRLTKLVSELNRTARPREATNYYPEYPGFQRVFRVPIAHQDSRLVRQFPDALEHHARAEEKVTLARGLFQCIAQLSELRIRRRPRFSPAELVSLLRG